VSDCCLTPNEQFFSDISYGQNKLHSMKSWWCRLCSRPTCQVGFL